MREQPSLLYDVHRVKNYSHTRRLVWSVLAVVCAGKSVVTEMGQLWREHTTKQKGSFVCLDSSTRKDVILLQKCRSSGTKCQGIVSGKNIPAARSSVFGE